MVQIFFDGVGNIVDKGENAGYYQHILLFPQRFKKASFPRSCAPIALVAYMTWEQEIAGSIPCLASGSIPGLAGGSIPGFIYCVAMLKE